MSTSWDAEYPGLVFEVWKLLLTLSPISRLYPNLVQSVYALALIYGC